MLKVRWPGNKKRKNRGSRKVDPCPGRAGGVVDKSKREGMGGFGRCFHRVPNREGRPHFVVQKQRTLTVVVKNSIRKKR